MLKRKDGRRAAWLDDRLYTFDSNPAHPDPSASEPLPYRRYDSPLSASTLLEHLKEKQFGHSELPDADRRLISIFNLSPLFVLALTETAPPHQAPSLIDAIFKHLALQTCLSVDISTGDFTVFQLQFHMPFYALRRGFREPCYKEEVFVKPRRIWRDISFLENGENAIPDAKPLGIHESHMAFTICGVANHRWIAYSFSDTDFDEDKDMGECEFDYSGMVADQIAADNTRPVNANHPIWNPREYFLLIASRRLNQIFGEWAKLIRKIENGIPEHTDGPPSVKTPSLGSNVNKDAMATFDRTQKTLRILWDLHDALARTNEEWKRFSSDDGDIGYFRDFENVPEVSQTPSQGLRPIMLEIKGKFDKLAYLQRRLDTLVRRCQMTADILELSLTLESNKAAKLSGSIAELMVVWVSPVAIVSAFFAIPEPFGGFHRTGGSFAAGFILVWGVLQFLIFVKEGRIRPRCLLLKIKNTRVKIHPRNLQFRERIETLRRKRLVRADTEATLVVPGAAAAAT
ncbi:hypothetical protein K458DRAFT_337807 [Lentithecium fluviatile CBS 122367]|uniref:Cora-domain-containing protein n=1 Tax=Lentithecium fluviatile CBS 122367 TaxID=1168545 RepID=A0A6G1J2J5_9PLEO|nr:hypothetical protein K458DRAFT_337807 [Lentithecium fluviatile CBS 122367]